MVFFRIEGVIWILRMLIFLILIKDKGGYKYVRGDFNKVLECRGI